MSNAANSTGPLVRMARKLVTALLPQGCLLCAAAAGDHLLCAACDRSLPLLTHERCPLCALPTPAASVCGACLKRPPKFDATQALYRYEFPVDRLIQSLKYAHRLASADFLGKALALLPLTKRPDLILPVPLAPTRLAGRGFNQAVELARPLARACGLPLEFDGVRRHRDTAPQASLPYKERQQNIRHAFECELDLAGKSVLLVDDVMTTGATLDELAATLKAHGAARVENLVVARALKA